MKLEEQYRLVLESLKLLSISEEEQVTFFPKFVDVPDDIISNFENVFLLLPNLIENNKYSNLEIASLLRLYNKIQWCLRCVDLDDFSNKEWNKVRELAKDTLLLLMNH